MKRIPFYQHRFVLCPILLGSVFLLLVVVLSPSEPAVKWAAATSPELPDSRTRTTATPNEPLQRSSTPLTGEISTETPTGPRNSVATEPERRELQEKLPEFAQSVLETRLDEAYPRLYAIASIPEKSREKRDALERIATHSEFDPSLRGLALWGLATIGELGPSRSSLDRGVPPQVQRTAVEMLRRHGGDPERRLLAQVASGRGDLSVRESALRSAFGLDPQASMSLLSRTLDGNAPPALQFAALELLAENPGPEALDLALSFRSVRNPDRAALHQARALLSQRAVDPARVDAALEELSTQRQLAENIRTEIERMRRGVTTAGWNVHPCQQGH